MWPTKSFHYMRWKIFAAKVKWRWARKSSLKGKNTLYPKLKLQNQGGPLRGISVFVPLTPSAENSNKQRV